MSHEPVLFQQILPAIFQAKNGKKKEVWFHQEAIILHVCCKKLSDANRLLLASKQAGFKRSGITSLGKRIIVEIVGSSHFETPVAKDGKILVSKELLAVLVAAANKRLKKNFTRIRTFSKAVIKRK